jgi:hypothetical protein
MTCLVILSADFSFKVGAHLGAAQITSLALLVRFTELVKGATVIRRRDGVRRDCIHVTKREGENPGPL